MQAIHSLLFIAGATGFSLSGLWLAHRQIISSILSGVTGIFLTTQAVFLKTRIKKMKEYSRLYSDVLRFLGLPKPRIITPARIRHELAHRDFISDAIEKLDFLTPETKQFLRLVSRFRRFQANQFDEQISQILAKHGFEGSRDDVG